MVNAPEKIRVAQDSDGFWTCREAVSGSQEYVRADLVAELAAENEQLKHALAAEKKRVTELEAQRKCYECGSEMTACAQCNPELLTAELTALRARVEELEIALSELINHTHNCEKELTEELHHQDFCGESLPLTNARRALKGVSHAE